MHASSHAAPWPVRCLALLLCLLMPASSIALQATGNADASDTSAKTAAHSKAKAKHKSKKSHGKKSAGKAASAPDAEAKPEEAATAKPSTEDKPAKPAAKAASKSAKSSTAGRAAKAARMARMKQAFVASSELRPMAQQLGALRTQAAYAGVSAYAHKHTGEAAAAAYLALGHAYLLDGNSAESAANFRLAHQSGESLDDYAEFLGAKAEHQANNQAAARALLDGFVNRHPDSIFVAEVPELQASILLKMNNAADAQRVLAAASSASAARPGFQLTQAEVLAALGQNAQAQDVLKRLLLAHPLTSEAETAFAKLTSMGVIATLTETELHSLGDAYYNGGHYAAAADQYRALAHSTRLSEQERNGFAVSAAACDLKLKRLTTAQAEALADTPDEHGARRLYLLMELARNRQDGEEQQRLTTRLQNEHPQSPWFAEALLSAGNMYMLRHEYAPAIGYYLQLSQRFPGHKMASAAHWRAAWLNYRMGNFSEAARLADEQICIFPNAKENAAALYWRGRIYETQEHDPSRAAANYRAIARVYQHYFYAQMARQRLAALGNTKPAPQPQLDGLQPPPAPVLNDSFPADSPHLAKARLLANAGLNDYIAREIAADPNSSSWSALAEAQIYASYGETFRALRALKRALPSAASASVPSIPLAYWRILYPKPYWDTIVAESAKNNLDPYLVASLIRQESEFNPGAISHANAYGLMQLLPTVGKAMAHQDGNHFQPFHLLDPETNIHLGTRNLRQTLDKFNGVVEYALAAYNAGDSRVVDWQANGPYSGIDEFVESIPFSETREYVQAILRNQETYRAIDDYAQSKTVSQNSRH